MKHPLLLALALSYSGATLIAQTAPARPTVAFELKLPELRKKDSAQRIPRVTNSLYNKIEFLDSRSTPVIGVYQKGAFNGPMTDLVLKQPVGPELTAILDSLTDSTAGNGELLFQLRRLHFAEESMTRYCYVEATLYAKAAGQYRPLLTLDTFFLARSMNVMDYMNGLARPLVCGFIRAALTLRPTDSAAYGIDAVGGMDSIDRRRLPLFTDTAWVDGLYLTYYSFSQQLPDRQCTVKTDKDGNVRLVKVLDAAGKAVEQKKQEMYAVVYQGRAFIATEYGFYPVTRMDNALEFTGDIRVPATASEMSVPSGGGVIGRSVAGGMVAGVAGVPLKALAMQGDRTKFVMVIDPLNGQLVHLRKIEPPPQVGY